MHTSPISKQENGYSPLQEWISQVPTIQVSSTARDGNVRRRQIRKTQVGIACTHSSDEITRIDRKAFASNLEFEAVRWRTGEFLPSEHRVDLLDDIGWTTNKRVALFIRRVTIDTIKYRTTGRPTVSIRAESEMFGDDNLDLDNLTLSNQTSSSGISHATGYT